MRRLGKKNRVIANRNYIERPYRAVKCSIRANKRTIRAAESYGWEVNDREAWDAYEFACDYFGKDNLNEEIVSTLGNEELAASLAFIFRNNDFREWDERNSEDEDYDEDDYE